MLNKKAITRVKLRCTGADDASQLGSGTSYLQEADRTLRSCGVNAMVCCMATLSDFRSKRIIAIIAHVPRPVVEWANEANRDLRKGVQGNWAWLLEQMQGKLYAIMRDVVEQLFDQEFLQHAGFLTTRTQNITGWTDEETQHEDAFATLAGIFATSYCMNRARRTLYLWGYPTT